ncbi:hypothetical protein [Roseicella aquatilis]|uniref:Uncharacterized protein n=1 Tax=Roseicella aquatilis TaxID=2527868 RepID=A0A4V2WL68_9PROT|nr:hypothetical protein [Roseicella aquatilis]TCZ61399.1 hypothetical protein EXY23_12725 [Roseicella aquatilis]
MIEASPAGRVSRGGIAGIEDTPRRPCRSAAPILGLDAAAPRREDAAGTEERRPEPNTGTGEGLRLEATLGLIRRAAEARRFVSYGEVAAASGLPWNAARRRMDPHLFALCQRATERGWPLLSALVVDKQSVPHGAMRGRPLVGFARAAERLGRIVGGDAASFLADEQARVFAWANKERGA